MYSPYFNSLWRLNGQQATAFFIQKVHPNFYMKVLDMDRSIPETKLLSIHYHTFMNS